LKAAEVFDLTPETNDFSFSTGDLVHQLSVLPLQLPGSGFETVPTEAASSSSTAGYCTGYCRIGLNLEAAALSFVSAIAAAVFLLQLQLPRAQSLLKMNFQ
jgi:hypothetical protein